MEDALVLWFWRGSEINLDGLNPCCNGRCTRTLFMAMIKDLHNGLNPCCNGRCTRTKRWRSRHLQSGVLILVVMEDALVRKGLARVERGIYWS